MIDEIEVIYDKNGKFYDHDDGVRPDSTLEKLGKLRPVFDRHIGNVTAGNSAQITDGAAWVLLASEDMLEKHNMTPMGMPGVVYRMINLPGLKNGVGGAMDRGTTMPVSAWMYYVHVADLDAATAKITAGGGTIVNGPMPIPGERRIVAFMDPGGAAFSLHGK